MLKQDYSAMEMMIRTVQAANRRVKETSPEDGKKKSKKHECCLEVRAVAGTLLAEYLQERLCRKYFGRAADYYASIDFVFIQAILISVAHH